MLWTIVVILLLLWLLGGLGGIGAPIHTLLVIGATVTCCPWCNLCECHSRGVAVIPFALLALVAVTGCVTVRPCLHPEPPLIVSPTLDPHLNGKPVQLYDPEMLTPILPWPSPSPRPGPTQSPAVWLSPRSPWTPEAVEADGCGIRITPGPMPLAVALPDNCSGKAFVGLSKWEL